MEETCKEEKMAASTEKRDGDYGDYSCSNILLCKYPLHETIRAIFFKCFGLETSNEPAAVNGCPQSSPEVKEIEPSTTEPVPLPPSSTPGPTVTSEDMAMRFRPPPRRPPTRGSGPQTNSSGSS